jgi:microcystin-dependent protein
MAVNYNFLKSLKGTSIGTIVPWTGDITAIPAGWIQCDGRSLSINDFPYLYDIIGNKYGGAAGIDFKIPSIQGKSIVDYHTAHDGATSYGSQTIDMPSSFTTLINDTDDVANQVNLVRTSNVDLFAFYNENVNTFLGFIEETSLNDPIYFDGLSTAGRAMGDAHYPTHSHGGSFNVVSKPNQWAEDCQNNGNANCILFCPDDCDSPQHNRMEANNPVDERQRIGVFDGSPASGEYITRSGNYQSAGGWAARRNPGQNGSTNYNYVDSGNMQTIGSISSPWSFAAVDTSSKYANFVNAGLDAMDAHVHPLMFYELTKGSMNVPATLVVNDAGRGNLQPLNQTNQAIASIRVNAQTPQLSILHIIRAY